MSEETSKEAIGPFTAANLFKEMELLFKHIGFTNIDVSYVDESKKLYVWFETPSIERLNLFLWAGCHRYFHFHELELFSVHIDHGDPNRESSNLKLVMRSNEIFTEDKLEDLRTFVNGLKRFVEEAELIN